MKTYSRLAIANIEIIFFFGSFKKGLKEIAFSDCIKEEKSFVHLTFPTREARQHLEQKLSNQSAIWFLIFIGSLRRYIRHRATSIVDACKPTTLRPIVSTFTFFIFIFEQELLNNPKSVKKL